MITYKEKGSSPKFCPICGELAISPHHIKPRSEGGTDDSRNICWLCKSCHDFVEQRQEETRRELSPMLIQEIREELRIKLMEDEEGISESYSIDPEGDVLLWIKAPDGSKRYINQRVTPYHEMESSPKNLFSPEALPKKGRGRPRIVVDDGFLESLIYRQSMSYRKASSFLRKQFSIKISDVGIYTRLHRSYVPSKSNSIKNEPETSDSMEIVYRNLELLETMRNREQISFEDGDWKSFMKPATCAYVVSNGGKL